MAQDSNILFQAVKNPNHDAEDFQWDLAIYLNLLALMMCYFASTWSLLVPTSCIHFIVEKFPLEGRLATWIAASTTIPICVIQAFVGDMSDILGRKPFLLIGMVLGLTGSLVSSRATSLIMVIGGQVLNGCGITLGYLSIPLFTEVVPKDKRPAVQGFSGIVTGTASLLGPMVQGAFIEKELGGKIEGWRVGFYISAILYAASFVLLAMFYHPIAHPNEAGESTMTRVMHIDWLGIFLVVTGLVLFLVGLQYGGNTYPWTSAVVLCTLIIGAVLLIIFELWEWKATSTGLFVHALFDHRNFTLGLLLNFVSGIVLFGGQAYLLQEIAALFTTDAIMAGVYNIPFNTMSIVGGFGAGIIMSITKEAKGLVIGSFILLLIGSGLMAVMEPHINFAAWFFPTSLLGCGVGAQAAIITVVISLCTPNKYIATALTLGASVRALGGSIVTDMLYPKVGRAIVAAGLPTAQVESFFPAVASGQTDVLQSIPGATSKVLEVFQSTYVSVLADCYRFIWYAITPFTAVTLIMSFFLLSTKAQMTRQVAAGVEW
ncbi:major facilitator superfamily domain-containing protein [Dactylonectria macrodidyma]|uniref:Major facilitator superfamily domain-containing protein n=1 Tax=Dactylonectria macrodidyma TaxID=307937 RepID=A0A9P9JPF7_9HYPO|nr:major facilitator superfamily domain-containing protein [Dactylonectria macrodidyma]